MIEFELNFCYEGETCSALQDAKGSVRPGKCVVLCGESGCGKTTLMRCMNHLIPAFYEGSLKGYCLMDDQDISNLSIGETGAIAASVFQDPRSHFFTVNLLRPAAPADQESHICCGERKYFSSASLIKISDNVHTAAGLGDAKILAVKHLPFHEIPQSLQRIEDCRKRPAAVMIKQSGNIFKQQIARLPGFSQSGKLKEQGPSGISESFSSASDAECLTRESTAEQVEFGHCFRIGFSGIVNEPLSFRIKQSSVAAQCILVALAVSHTLESSGPTKSFPETADPGKHINKSNSLAHPLLSLSSFQIR